MKLDGKPAGLAKSSRPVCLALLIGGLAQDARQLVYSSPPQQSSTAARIGQNAKAHKCDMHPPRLGARKSIGPILRERYVGAMAIVCSDGRVAHENDDDHDDDGADDAN